VTPAPSDLALSDDLIQEAMLWPQDLMHRIKSSLRQDDFKAFLDVSDAQLRWVELIRELCHRFWPQRYFINPFDRGGRHPAAGVASASLLHLSPTTMLPLDLVERLIPPFQIGPQSLPYSPLRNDVSWNQAMNLGQLLFYERFVEDMLRDEPERLREVTKGALEEGMKFRDTMYPEGSMPPETSRWWWYIPILPGMSAEDLRRAASLAEEAARFIGGDASIDAMITELKKMELSHQRVADLLGIDVSTVTRRLKSMREE
jgi:hypothetical protein